jgi:sulfoxide reductase catalytic subunit YedY
MLIRKPAGIAPSEITPENVWLARRRWLARAGAAAGGAALGMNWPRIAGAAAAGPGPLAAGANPRYVLMEKQTALEDATHYNNFYEFGMDKDDPARHAHKLITRPWTVRVEGEVHKPREFGIEDLLKLAPMEERV